MSSRVSLCAKDVMSKHFVQVSILEMEAGTCLNVPLAEEARADDLKCPGGQVE